MVDTTHKKPVTNQPEPRLFWALLIAVAACGAWFRLDQFFIQVLIDDEWHAVHQLLKSRPERIMLSFGHADYSIPLTLLYWWQAATFGLSESLMRWPMLTAGLATLIFLPWLTARRLQWTTALGLAVLLAISPLLIAFAQKARPYALNVLLVWLSVWLFYHHCHQLPGKRLWTGIGYTLVSALAVWTHLIVALFIAAPFLLEGWRLLRLPGNERKHHFLCLLSLGLPAGLLTLTLTLPPLLHDAYSLLGKTQKHHASLDTIVGAWHLWLGTASPWLALVALILAIIGMPRLWRHFPEARAVALGALLTLILVLLTGPAWSNHSLVVARYLLPVLPLILLALVVGIQQLGWKTRPAIAVGLMLILVIGLLATSPVPDWLRNPNGNKSHTALIFEFRPHKNKAMDYMRQRPVPPFWKQLADKPRNSLIVAVAPFAFESYHWDAIFWEPASGQRVIPGLLLGLCTEQRNGEVPDNGRFRFSNVAYLARPTDAKQRGVDYILWQKPAYFGEAQVMTHKNLTGCEEKIRQLYGQPVYEDDKIAVFPTHRNMPSPPVATTNTS